MEIFRSCFRSLKAVIIIGFALFARAAFAQLNPPGGISATGQCAVVDLAWTPVQGASSYYVYRSSELSGDYYFVSESLGSAFRDGTSSWLGLDYSTTYYYKVSTVDPSGEGALSAAVAATTLPPTNQLTTVPSGASITVKWGSVSGSARLHRVTYNWLGQDIASFTTTPTSYLDRTAPNDVPSYYRLYSDAKGWLTGPSSGGSQADILSSPFDIDPNPTNGVLSDALILPPWMEHTMPVDSSNAPSGGPSSAITIELAHGVASAYAPGVTTANPNGSDFGFSLQYRTALAAGNVASPGLPVGWFHNWDIRMIQDGSESGWEKSFRLVYPSGASEILTPVLDNGNPTGAFTTPPGAPYIVTGVPSSSAGNWDSLTISCNGNAKQVFAKDAGDTFFRIHSQVDPNGTSTLYFTYNGGKLTQIDNGLMNSFEAAIVITYSGGTISKVETLDHSFVRNYKVDSGQLTGVSRLNLSTSSLEWTYGYQILNSLPYLNSVGSISPSGSTTYAAIDYDPDSGRAYSTTDAIGNSRLYSYTVSEDGGQTTTAGARTTTIKDESGNTFDVGEVICDERGRETATKDRLGATTTISYADDSVDPSAVVQVAPPIGNPSLAEYDSHGNLTKATAPYGNYTRFTWEYPAIAPLGRITKIQEFGNDGQNGNDGTPKAATSYTYYASGEQDYNNPNVNSGPIGYLKRVTFPNGGYLQYSYAANGNVLKVTGLETYTYGYLWNSFTLIGRPTSVTDVNSKTTTFGYDSFLRLSSVTDPQQISTSVEYNEYGQVKKTYLPGSQTLTTAYQVNGRGAYTNTLQNSVGTTTLYTNTYNAESLLTSSKNSLNVTESQAPNAALGLSSVQNGNSQTMHQFTPDTTQRTVDYRIGTGSNAVGIRTTLDAMGNAVSTKQILPSTADIGNVTYRGDDPDMVASSSSSNSSTYAANFNTSYTYDKFGRIWTATSQGTGTSSVNQVTPYTVMHTYTYDDEDHILTDNNITYTYYAKGMLKTMTVPDSLGNYVRYTYDYDLKLRTTSIAADKVGSQGNLLANITSASYVYDDSDRVIAVWTAYGATKYVYDSSNRLSALYNLRSDSNSSYQITVNTPSGGTTALAVLSSFTNITYDKLNNRSGMSIMLAKSSGNPTNYNTGTVTFVYDDVNRLTSEVWSGDIVGGTTVTYGHAYDNADNLTTIRSNSQSVDILSDILTTGFSFNSFGDCEGWTNKAFDGTSSSMSATLGWDPVGQLTRVSGNSAVTNSFGSAVTEQMAYDDQGRRAWSRVYGYKIQSSGPTNYTDSYTYSGSDLVMRTSLGTVNFIGGTSVTVGNDFYTNPNQGNGTIFYLVGPTGPVTEFDVYGNRADLTYDPQGSCVASFTGPIPLWVLYDAYGKPVAKHPNMTLDQASRLPLNQPLQYKGQFGYIADAHTGAYYCTHRFYDPNTGRWLSRDPIGLEGGTNTYSYCGGNPVMRADPSGLDWKAFIDYLNKVGGVFDGYGEAIDSAILGLIHSTTPFLMYKNAQDLGDWAGHGWSLSYMYDKKIGGFKNGVAHFWNGISGEGSPEDFGESFGTSLIFAATVGEGVSGIISAFEKGSILEAASAPRLAGEVISNAGVALSKHPEIIGETKLTFNKIYRTDAARNAAAQSLVRQYMKEGIRSTGVTKRGGLPYVQYGIKGKGAVRFNPKTGKWIGFIDF